MRLYFYIYAFFIVCQDPAAVYDTGTTTPGQNGTESNGNEKVFHTC